MAEKINVTALKAELYSQKSVSVCNQLLADKKSPFGIGSAAAEAAATSAAMILLALGGSDGSDPEVKKAATDAETLRTYFLRLIDEEIKCKAPLEKRRRSRRGDRGRLPHRLRHH